MLWLWIVLAIVSVLLLIVAFFFFQYVRLRRKLPRPKFRPTKLHPDISKWPKDEVTVTWIGHSTLYIQFYDVGILTDPVFSSTVGVKVFPGVTIGPKRYTSPALRLEDVALKVNLVLLSHAHLDHFDLPSLRRIARPEVEVITAKNTSRLLAKFRFRDIVELSGNLAGSEATTGRSTQTRSGIQVTAVPVRHWGARFPWNKDYHWTGYVLEYRGTRLLFAGDTASTDAFKEVRKNFGPIDLAVMPIGAYSPDTFQGSHCTPEQAWEMFEDSGAKWIAPVHWNTFVLSMEPIDEPLQRLARAAGTKADRIVICEQGETFQLPSSP